MHEDTIVAQFSKEKATPNTVKFAEDVAEGRDRGVVGSIYVLKSDLENLGNPNTILVTISPVS